MSICHITTMTLITNNPALFGVACRRPGLDLVVVPLSDSAYAVTQTARDHIHRGFRLLHHPLYGNFKPDHQPFRTLLLAAPTMLNTSVRGTMPTVDHESLHMIEQALLIHERYTDRHLTPDGIPQTLFDDCSKIDIELMRATMDAYCHP